MRVERVHIASFGGETNKTVRLEPGLNVVYGLNEAGKTTLKSFITGTMFPDKLPSYPAAKASDAGDMDVVLEDGSIRTITRKGRRSDSPVPELCLLTGTEYRAIYSLGTEDLRNMDILLRGELRGRLIAVPGAEAVPGAMGAIRSAKTSLMPEGRRSSSCELARLRAGIDACEERVAELGRRAEGDSAYNGLVADEASLSSELAQAEETEKRAFEKYSATKSAEGRAENIAKADALRREREQYEYAANADDESEKKYTELVTRAKVAGDAYERKSSETAEELVRLGGRSPEDIIALEPRVVAFSRRSPNVSGPAPAGDGGSLLPVVAGGFMAVAGIGILVTVSAVAGAVVTAIGAVVMLVALVRRRKAPAPAAPSRDESYEAEWDELCALFDIRRTDSASDDADRMAAAVSRARKVADLRSETAAYEEASRKARGDLDLFLSGFGGEEKFRRARADYGALRDIDAKLEAIGDVLPDSGEPAPSDGVSVEEDPEAAYMAARSSSNELRSRLSAVRAAKNAVLGDTETEKALTDLSTARNGYASKVREWTVLALESAILDRACEGAYGRSNVSTFSDADRFLKDMTGGRYDLTADPVAGGFTVKEAESGSRKDDKSWSTGTEDQVKLALKMGLALSIGAEKPPVILDDILLTSDDVRRRGGIRAIQDLAESVQVIYFTCSGSARDAFAEAGARIIPM